jgi:transposase
MRFVPAKSEEQQAVLMVLRARSLVIENRTAQVNQTRGLLAEFGIVVALGIEKLCGQVPAILEDAENGLPTPARETFAELLEQWRYLDKRVAHYDRQIAQLAATSEPAQRLMGMAGIGPLTATALVASVGDAKVFESDRQFAAGSEWFRDSIRAAASSVWARSPNAAMRICGDF